MGTHSAVARHGARERLAPEDAFYEEHGYLEHPRLVQLLVTQRCVLSCPHCLAHGAANAADMPLAMVEQVIDAAADMDVEELLITGGEPLARADFPAIVDRLRARRRRWSLNTALLPDREQRAAIAAWPPSFVAVSVDGPEELHDAFRGRAGCHRAALEAIAWFREVADGEVVMGTTVTARNFAALPDTFRLALTSGATGWGLHLVVPEGRAARRPDLLLDDDELAQLLEFAAIKRQHFPVSMADEIGFCGGWEALVRETTFYCGAGRAQCVVLPDGAVVPCTTMDRAVSAGNVARRSLPEIWRAGFGELRRPGLPDSCRRCRHRQACQGGCWLQRRHGAQCFRPVWSRPHPLVRAGTAVSLGLALLGAGACQKTAGPAPPSPAPAPTTTPAPTATRSPARPVDSLPVAPAQPAAVTDTPMELLQRSIVEWYAGRFERPPRDPAPLVTRLQADLPEDPAAAYFIDVVRRAERPPLAALAEQITAALGTEQRSLCLIALAWRDLTEHCLSGAGPVERSAADRELLQQLHTRLGATAAAWQLEIFAKQLDPFLRQPGQYRKFFRSKAGPGRLLRARPDLRRANKRGMVDWGGGRPTNFKAPAYGVVMHLAYVVADDTALTCRRHDVARRPDGRLRPFDILETADAPAVVEIAFPGHPRKLPVTLPAGAACTYGDVLRLLHEQHAAVFAALTSRQFSQQRFSLHPWPGFLPEIRRRLALPKEGLSDADREALRWVLTDMYLF